jgi:hypothetical protein
LKLAEQLGLIVYAGPESGALPNPYTIVPALGNVATEADEEGEEIQQRK